MRHSTNPFADLGDSDRPDDSQPKSKVHPSRPRAGRGISLVIVASLGALLLAGLLLAVVALWGRGGASKETVEQERPPAKLVSKARKQEQQTPAPQPQPPTAAEEAAADAAYIASLSPNMRARVESPWRLIQEGMIHCLAPYHFQILDDNGMGLLLDREIIRFYKNDPECQEFRKLTGCDTDYQYIRWGRCAPVLRKLALAHVRNVVSQGEDQRDLVPFLKEKIREAGGADWLTRGPTPSKKK